MSQIESPPNIRRRWRWMPSLVLLCALGCNLGGGSKSPMQPPPPAQYERTFDEINDIPHQITVHVEWAAQPIDGAIALADEVAALRTKLSVSVDADALTSTLTSAFKGGSVEIGGELEASRAEIEALIAKLQQVANDLKSIPERTKAATKGISRLVISTPKLAAKASRELAGELKVATGDGAVQIKGDIAAVKALPNEVKTQATAAKNVVTGLPAKAKTATTNLMAAIAGKPYEPMETTGGAAGAASADGEGAADASAVSPTAVASADVPTTDPFSAGGSDPSVSPFDGASPGKAVAKAPKATPKPSSSAKPTQSKDDPVHDRVVELQRQATAMGKYGDWLSAADTYDEALALAPTETSLHFAAGNAAMKAKDCPRAQVHFDLYLRTPDTDASQRQAAQKALGELRTFDCPARTPQDEAAVAQTLRNKGNALAKEDDHGGAALMYALAYQRASNEPLLAFETGVASWKAHACGDAVSYFYHFLTVADSRAHRRQVDQSNRYIEQSEGGGCQPPAQTEREQRARALYGQAQELMVHLDYAGAVGKYERAYALMPDNHAFDLRIAETYSAAGDCAGASEHYRSFIANASDPRYAADVSTSKAVLAQLEASNCASGLASASASAGAGIGGAGGPSEPGAAGGDGEGPPALPPSGGSARCSVTPGSSGGLMPLGLLMLMLVRRRRSRHTAEVE